MAEINNAVGDFWVSTFDSSLYITGSFTMVNGDSTVGVARYKDGLFSRLDCGLNWNCTSQNYPQFGTTHPPNDLIEFQNKIYVTGAFTYTGDLEVNRLAKWDGTNWDSCGRGLRSSTQIGSGVGYSLNIIDDLLFVTGAFDSCNSIQANSIVYTDGTNWFPFPVPVFSNNPNLISGIEKYNNEYYVHGVIYDPDSLQSDFWNLVKFDGVNWLPVANGIKGGSQWANKIMVHDGLLYVAGRFSKSSIPTNPGNGIAAFDGQNWIDLGGGLEGIGNMPIVHDFTFHDGKLYCVGLFKKAGGVPCNNIAYWDGQNWFSLDTAGSSNGIFTSVRFYQDTLMVGGSFFDINGDSTIQHFVKWVGGDYYEAYGNTTGSTTIQYRNKSLTLSPNPCTTALTVSSVETPFQFQFYNLHGQEVISGTSNTKQLDVTALKPGMYFLKVKDRNGTRTGKVVKVEP